MTPEVKRNKEFTKWLWHWIAAVQQNRPRLSAHYARRQPVQTGKNILTAHTYLAQTCTPHPVGTPQGVLSFHNARNNQVRLSEEVFNSVSNPVSVGDNFVFVDALERKSGQVRRVRIPPSIVRMARITRRAA
jgi:hypothetical protein